MWLITCKFQSRFVMAQAARGLLAMPHGSRSGLSAPSICPRPSVSRTHSWTQMPDHPDLCAQSTAVFSLRTMYLNLWK